MYGQHQARLWPDRVRIPLQSHVNSDFTAICHSQPTFGPYAVQIFRDSQLSVSTAQVVDSETGINQSQYLLNLDPDLPTLTKEK